MKLIAASSFSSPINIARLHISSSYLSSFTRYCNRSLKSLKLKTSWTYQFSSPSSWTGSGGRIQIKGVNILDIDPSAGCWSKGVQLLPEIGLDWLPST